MTVQLSEELCAAVAAADPLGADRVLATLPEVNERGDLRRLAAILAELGEAAARAGLFTLKDRLAAMRDLGMLLGSFKRYGTEPLAAVPAAEPLLLRLGDGTDMVPRDTVLHYGAWNPSGGRQRMYTGAFEEGVLIESVRVSAMGLERSALELAVLDSLDPADPQYAETLARATESFMVLPDQIGRVAELVPPAEFFIARLRPYMEDVAVGGQTFYGPAAAHVPLYLIDHLLWSSDRVDPEHAALHQGLLDYGLPEWGGSTASGRAASRWSARWSGRCWRPDLRPRRSCWRPVTRWPNCCACWWCSAAGTCGWSATPTPSKARTPPAVPAPRPRW